MRIAYFHTGTVLSSWSLFSMGDTLRSMGHEVLEGTIPTNAHGAVVHQVGRAEYERTLAKMPTLEGVQSCDVILVAGPEYVAVWLNTLYGKEQWCKLKARRVALYLESTKRQDVQFRYDIFSEWYDVHYFPDREDAARLGGHYLRGSIDLGMFKPCVLENEPGHTCDQACYSRRMAEKKYEAAFVGSLYQKRIEFLGQLLPLLPEVDFYANGVTVRDLGGECQREWAELLAKNIRQIKVHVALPSNNMRMTVSRPFETLACGTFLLTYNTDDNPFRDGVHCRIYDPAKPQELADLIRYYIAHEDEREAIARAGCEEVRRNYSLRDRLGELLDSVTASSVSLHG
ncbi:MAG: glycosyltransferase [Acidobacteriia bacterium]|nr:glycosyltransferase [Terriglobia bacterium]